MQELKMYYNSVAYVIASSEDEATNVLRTELEVDPWRPKREPLEGQTWKEMPGGALIQFRSSDGTFEETATAKEWCNTFGMCLFAWEPWAVGSATKTKKNENMVDLGSEAPWLA